MTGDHPSAQEIQRVREYECELVGHRWNEDYTFGNAVPIAIHCGNCGLTVPIPTPDEIRYEVAARLRQQPWANALGIADAIEKNEWDV